MRNQEDYNCYLDAYTTKDWSRRCDFLQNSTLTKLRVSDLTLLFKNGKISEIDANPEHFFSVIIDNTPFPEEGANAYTPIELAIDERTVYTLATATQTLMYLSLGILISLAVGCVVTIYLINKFKEDVEKNQELLGGRFFPLLHESDYEEHSEFEMPRYSFKRTSSNI